MLTGKATLDVAVSAINDGAVSRFFTQPCNPVDLAITIRPGLQQKDLMIEAKRLLKKVKEQGAILDHLERESPGITQMNEDEREVIILDDHVAADHDEFIEELHRTFGE